MIEAAEFANAIVFDEFQGSGGTTLSAVAIDSEGYAFGINVGDSRIYTIRNNNHLVQESRDDTVSSQLAALGEPSEHAKSELIQFLGMGPDLLPNPLKLGSEADNLGLLLTSDGAHSIPGLVELTRYAQTPRELVDRILAVSMWVGGRDNASVLALSLRGLLQQRVRSDEVLEFTDSFGTLELPSEWARDASYWAYSDRVKEYPLTFSEPEIVSASSEDDFKRTKTKSRRRKQDARTEAPVHTDIVIEPLTPPDVFSDATGPHSESEWDVEFRQAAAPQRSKQGRQK